MNASEFVAALHDLATADTSGRAAIQEWSRVLSRPSAFDHPPDPVLNLLADYHLSAVKFWQLAFTDRTSADTAGLWHVADRSTDSFYIQDGELLMMYYKADYPDATGLSSAQFLQIVLVYARMLAALPDVPWGPQNSLIQKYAGEAAAISPNATSLGWFDHGSPR